MQNYRYTCIGVFSIRFLIDWKDLRNELSPKGMAQVLAHLVRWAERAYPKFWNRAVREFLGERKPFHWKHQFESRPKKGNSSGVLPL